MQIPDNIRPAVDIIVKHHFWMLAALVPLVVLPLAWLAAADLSQKIKTKQGAIDSKITSVRNVQGTAEHPNEGWAEVLAKDTAKVKRDTLAEWQRFYDEQAPIRVWPESLGQDFVERASKLQPGGRLPRPLLERYQEGVKNVVRALPKRMGADDLMPSMADEEGAARPAKPGAAGPRSRPPSQSSVQWSEGSQQRIYESFNWQKPPTTVQVQLAQEEIWMYELLCDIVKKMNERATAAFDSAIPFVEELAVGYPAAEEKPGGAGEARIVKFGGPAAEPLPDGSGQPGAGPLSRPSHPRFGGSGGRAAGGSAAAADGAPASPDDIFRNWIYVGFDGRPLMAAEQTASLANRMIHFIPFRMRAVMDQRRLDDLLVTFAASAIPIDVRQVRVNPGASSQRPGGGGVDSRGIGYRPYDVAVEIRGTIAVAAQPDRKALLGDLPDEEPPMEQPAAAVEVEAEPGEPAPEPTPPEEEAAPAPPVEEAPPAPEAGS
jgi:hypothetical protein